MGAMDYVGRGEFEELKRKIRALETQSPLDNASVENGRLRFVGGVLRLDSGARIEVIGEWRFVGPGAITGDVVAEGKWTQNGVWEFNGDGDIDGDVDLTGNLKILGGGKITAGNVRIEDGKIYVGTGGGLIVIDGATGKITAGNLSIDPSSNGGSVKFAGGPEVYASGGVIYMYSVAAGAFIELGSVAKLNGPGARFFEVNSTGFRFVGLPTKTAASTGLPAGVLHADSSGNVFRIVT